MSEKISPETEKTTKEGQYGVANNTLKMEDFGSPRDYDLAAEYGTYRKDIFATPIYVGEDADHASLTDKYLKKGYELFDRLELAGTVSDGWSKGETTSSTKVKDTKGVTSFFNGNLAPDPEWAEFNEYILGMALTMLKDTVPEKLLHGFTIANSWLTLYPNGAYVPEHIHSCFEVSGVYYLKAQGEQKSGMISFKDPSWVAKTMNIWGQGSRIFPGPSTVMEFAVKSGMMVLFPSWLPHSTMPNESGEDRMIYSFNLITDNARLRLVHNHGHLNR